MSEKMKNLDFISEKQVKSLARKINMCVNSPLDKNKLCHIVACKYLFWLKMNETYIEDTLHYDIESAISEDELLNNFVEWYKNLNCSIPLAPKHLWCIPGYATILFKDKDTYKLDCNIRVRTVIGASREGKSHPFKKALQA